LQICNFADNNSSFSNEVTLTSAFVTVT
jgi:hypothetical protein